MYLLLTLLLLTPLLVPPAFAQTYAKFKKQHTYSGNVMVDCNRDLNPILQSLNKACKPCNSFILGDQRFATDTNDVDQVCGRGGVNVGGNKFESKKKFRLVKCSRTGSSGTKPPNCDYHKVGQGDIVSTKITLSCEKNLPVHFNPC